VKKLLTKILKSLIISPSPTDRAINPIIKTMSNSATITESAIDQAKEQAFWKGGNLYDVNCTMTAILSAVDTVNRKMEDWNTERVTMKLETITYAMDLEDGSTVYSLEIVPSGDFYAQACEYDGGNGYWIAKKIAKALGIDPQEVYGSGRDLTCDNDEFDYATQSFWLIPTIQ
jgi:hypothetical protein